MMRSLFSGVAGLRNHQTSMDVIGNNIANVNTVGFKESTISFQDTLSQTLQGASAPQTGKGGTNPIQIGLGMGVASINTLFTDGSLQSTGKQTDLAISGQGFFMISPDGTDKSVVYTRAGGFDFDSQGNYIVPGTGYRVMGYQATNGKLATTPSAITIPTNTQMMANPTTKITYTGNLTADGIIDQPLAVPPVLGTTVQAAITTYDSNGESHKVSGTFTKTGALKWSFAPGTGTPKQTNDGLTISGTASYTVTFKADGSIDTAALPANTAFTFTPTTGGSTVNVIPDFSKMTQYGGDSTALASDQDGYAAGVLQSTTTDKTGTITGKFSNGQSQTLAQVLLATFNNPGGLTKVGSNVYAKSSNSGEPGVGTASSGSRGTLTASYLEMSNVDLAEQFSTMITTQRGFQSNSKIITTADTMLEELVNLKR